MMDILGKDSVLQRLRSTINVPNTEEAEKAAKET